MDLQVDVLRLDKIHPEISGNKWFKLKYYLQKARLENKKRLISFGGAYSNHLLALAAISGINGFSSMAIVRGEEPARLSHTLLAAKEYGMELRFLSRQDYQLNKRSTGPGGFGINETDDLLIPEGGAGPEGLRGAEEILSLMSFPNYEYICAAAGTGITLAGIINGAAPDQKIIGISVLKGTRDFEPMHGSWIKQKSKLKNVQIIHTDHFGGYAKNSNVLLEFMNRTFLESGIPTDFVYTGKLFYSVVRMAVGNFFPAGSRILIIHSGGLKGNRSLASGLLQF
jgi:1-aminocyclopropane-1-carboxylate deaminase/D-cysteine desulfhydrase-like pyridoxal-dependent ACC family enzyme